MSYTAPSISASGLQINNYPTIVQYLVAAFQNIYGPNCYLGPDSADYQDISIRALQNSDLENALAAVYLSMNPLTAVGASLDLLGVLIGLSRKPATNSTVGLTITGTAGTVITNGVAQDTSGNYWNLPTVVTLPTGTSPATTTITATAQNLGAVTALANTITTIATPTLGWTSVTNPSQAVAGTAIETDSNYRARLLISQAQPSLTTAAGTAASIASLYGVNRSIVYENPSNATQSFGVVNVVGTAVTLVAGMGYPFDSSMVGLSINIAGFVNTITAVGSSSTLTVSTGMGNLPGVTFFTFSGSGTTSTGGNIIGPAHSISCVVEGGVQADVAAAIYNNRGMGCYTNGTTSTSVTDPNNVAINTVINYYTLQYTPIYVILNVKKLAGYTSATTASIISNIVDYLNSLAIGETVVISELYGAALNARSNPDQPTFSIRSVSAGKSSSPTGTSDIPIAFNYAAQGIQGNISVVTS